VAEAREHKFMRGGNRDVISPLQVARGHLIIMIIVSIFHNEASCYR
jgi:hypothetical protein